MQKRKVKVRNPHGLHLRNAAELVKLANRYTSKITLCHGCVRADTCSILQVMALGAGPEAELEIIADGPDETAAIGEIAGLFSEGGGI